MKNQKGFTILEVLAALSISSILMIAGANLADSKSQDVTDQNTAQYQSAINDAALRYAESISAAIQADGTITLTNPKVVKFSDMIGFIPTTFKTATTNPYKQTPCALVFKDPVKPTDISILVVTEGGTPVPTGRVPALASLVGSSGGYILPASPTNASGVYGKWTKAIPQASSQTCTGVAATANHLASFLSFDSTSLNSNYLYKATVPGHPEANAMTAPLVMQATKTLEQACNASEKGSITQNVDGSGGLLVCDGANYKSQGSAYWKDPVANFASLPACNAAAVNQTRIVSNPSVGSGARPYTCNGAGVWQALSVDDSGNLSVAGTVNANKVVLPAGNSLQIGGSLFYGDGVNTAIRQAGNFYVQHADGSAADIAQVGNVNAQGNVSANTLQVNGVATINTGCSSNGLVARDASGGILSCYLGVWKSITNCGLGCGQSWVNVSGQRTYNTNYGNNSLKPILVNIGVVNGGPAQTNAYVNGVQVGHSLGNTKGGFSDSTISFVVPPSGVYVLIPAGPGGNIINSWSELK